MEIRSKPPKQQFSVCRSPGSSPSPFEGQFIEISYQDDILVNFCGLSLKFKTLCPRPFFLNLVLQSFLKRIQCLLSLLHTYAKCIIHSYQWLSGGWSLYAKLPLNDATSSGRRLMVYFGLTEFLTCTCYTVLVGALGQKWVVRTQTLKAW